MQNNHIKYIIILFSFAILSFINFILLIAAAFAEE